MALINGTNENDNLMGTNEADTIFGFNGNDSLQGLEGNDLLDASNGNDYLWGGDGQDTLNGGNGNDYLYTSPGHDDLIGGKGDDVFVLGIGIGGPASGGTNHILDFKKGADLIKLPEDLAFERLSIANGTGDHANDAVISDSINGQPLAIVTGVDSSTLKRSDFIANDRDIVLDWNAKLLETIKSEGLLPPVASRALAMLHTSVYDAVNAIDKKHSSYFVKDIVAPPGASREAAAAGAAHQVLVNLFPGQKATFDALLTSSLAEVPDGQAENDGVALGRSVANEIIEWRSTDDIRQIPPNIPYTPGTEPGDWQPTPPGFSLPHYQQWPNITPWTLTSSSQFRLGGPPAVNSSEYGAEFNQVKELGSKDSTTRTADQTEIALFWNDPQGTFLPPGHWNQIAEQASLRNDYTLSENAHLFAKLNIAIADALIAGWDSKTFYDFWRPDTAIEKADTDSNPVTTGDPAWTPLLITPPFQEYVSAHSTVSGAAGAILTSFFGDDFSFTTVTPGLPGIARSLGSFSETANEIGYSRLYGGIHFNSGIEDGLKLGESLGNYVAENFLV
jgi:PAP2 superfamily/RTX calcium-binding nonapeptide repeat (4 copies)